jgi:hypothetical protein
MKAFTMNMTISTKKATMSSYRSIVHLTSKELRRRRSYKRLVSNSLSISNENKIGAHEGYIIIAVRAGW